MKLSASTALLVALVLSGCGSVEMAPQMESAKAKSLARPKTVMLVFIFIEIAHLAAP